MEAATNFLAGFILFVVFFAATSSSDSSKVCKNIPDSEKFDCYPEYGSNEEKCSSRGCCWAPKQLLNRSPQDHFPPLDVPWCFYPKNYGGYEYVNLTRTENGDTAFLRRTFPSPYPKDVKNIRLDVEYQTDTRLRVKMYDAENKRYEPMYPKISRDPKDHVAIDPKYRIEIDLKQTGFKIRRKDGDVLFDCQNLGGFIFADQFLQISSKINGKIYGLGEHQSTFWLDTHWTRFTLFAHDSPPRENVNLYGTHPFYLVVEPSGKSHGVFFHNSDPMDVLLQPFPAITFRAIGGIFDFYFFVGPTPADVIRQYTELIGRPFLPPYWSLGFQLCKYGYGSLENTRAVWQRTRSAKIPFDVQYNDIDYMDNQNDFTVDTVKFGGLSDFIKEVHEANMHYILILDAGVSASEPEGTYPPYDDGVAEDIFVKNKNGEVFVGKVWNPNSTVFPDFTNPKVSRYWTKLVRDLHQSIPFDGLWIDMNEPANFLNGSINGCPDNELENPPYVPGVDGNTLNYKTLCMSAKQHAGNHYDVHNLYGISQSEITQSSVEEVTGKRAFVLSRSTYAGSGRYTAHWTGDNFSTWHDLTKSIPAMLSFSLYGISMVGADICGFIGNTTKSLCNRWMQLGAFYPFSRNHNSLGNLDQDPSVFGQEVINSSIISLNIRYSLLPYLYTLFYRAHVNGDTVARPLFFEFPHDEKTHQIDRTFLWGRGLYIVPITEDHTNKVTTYLPAGRWYDWYNSTERTSKGEEVTLETDEERIPLLIRGGTVFPIQRPSLTTAESRKNPFTFLAAPDNKHSAVGELFWDDGISIGTIENKKYGIVGFNLTERLFVSNVRFWNLTTEIPILETIKILGTKNVKSVTLNNKSKEFENESSILIVTNINLPINEKIDLAWTTH